ncbi:MAG: hypothetical protein ACFE94_12560 [Candidatus Hodarchaeota archaeon]
MIQIYEKAMEKKSSKIEQNEILGDLNPRYFEEAYSLQEAKDRALANRVACNGFFGGF